MDANERESTRVLAILSRVVLPLRIISFLSILSLFSIKISFDSAQFIFYGFFVIVFSSFVMEYLQYKKHHTRSIGLTLKYLVILPFEFIGVFTLTMNTLPFPNQEQMHNLEINVSVMVFGVGVIGELLHYVLFSTEKFHLNRGKILAIILGAALSVYEGIFMELFVLTTKTH